MCNMYLFFSFELFSCYIGAFGFYGCMLHLLSPHFTSLNYVLLLRLWCLIKWNVSVNDWLQLSLSFFFRWFVMSLWLNFAPLFLWKIWNSMHPLFALIILVCTFSLSLCFPYITITWHGCFIYPFCKFAIYYISQIYLYKYDSSTNMIALVSFSALRKSVHGIATF